jgi:hypothetical protein
MHTGNLCYPGIVSRTMRLPTQQEVVEIVSIIILIFYLNFSATRNGA